MRTRIPYRTILAAVARGELAAVRPSGSARGQILISESAWSRWLEHCRVRVRATSSGRASRRPLRSLADLAIS